MIRRLRWKFIRVAVLCVAAVLFLVTGAANAVNLYQMDRKAETLLTMLGENGGTFPKGEKGKPPAHMEGKGGVSVETPFETRYFTVHMKEDGAVSQMDTSHIAAITSKQALELAGGVWQDGRESGYRGVYKYKVVSAGEEQLILFLDCRVQLQTALSFLLASFGIGLLGLGLVFLLVWLFSGRVLRPVLESMEKQKQFITDAGHELKTPLSIISANVDVLELEQGGNEWLQSIRGQARRMDRLVAGLLSLAKMEESDLHLPGKRIPLSAVVLEAAQPFAALAQAQSKQLELDISPGIAFYGNEEAMRRFVSILLDNAVTYAEDGSCVRLSLHSRGKNIVLETENPCPGLREEELPRLFDRFYRADRSRSRGTGGYGIGLSAAAAIVKAHRGRLGVKKEGDVVRFTAIF